MQASQASILLCLGCCQGISMAVGFAFWSLVGKMNFWTVDSWLWVCNFIYNGAGESWLAQKTFHWRRLTVVSKRKNSRQIDILAKAERILCYCRTWFLWSRPSSPGIGNESSTKHSCPPQQASIDAAKRISVSPSPLRSPRTCWIKRASNLVLHAFFRNFANNNE